MKPLNVYNNTVATIIVAKMAGGKSVKFLQMLSNTEHQAPD